MATFRGPSPVDLSLTVNGDDVVVHVPPHRSLLDTLRQALGLTGTKKVCNEGDCGACTVLVDGRAVYACLTLAIACEGKRIETIEGLSRDGLHPLQQAFIEHDAYQCGFCTPGQLMSLVALLRARAEPNEDDIRRAVAGNLCRCGAYPNIVAAGLAAARGGGAPRRAGGARSGATVMKKERRR